MFIVGCENSSPVAVDKGEPVFFQFGHLTSEGYDAVNQYWDILNYFVIDTVMVQVQVRKGVDYLWITPSYLQGKWYIRIIDNDLADMGDEYKILVHKRD
jgi:hypothetical protein